MSTDGQRSKWRRNIAENFNRLSRVYERYRQTDGHSERERETCDCELVWRTVTVRLRLKRGNY